MPRLQGKIDGDYIIRTYKGEAGNWGEGYHGTWQVHASGMALLKKHRLHHDGDQIPMPIFMELAQKRHIWSERGSYPRHTATPVPTPTLPAPPRPQVHRPSSSATPSRARPQTPRTQPPAVNPVPAPPARNEWLQRPPDPRRINSMAAEPHAVRRRQIPSPSSVESADFQASIEPLSQARPFEPMSDMMPEPAAPTSPPEVTSWWSSVTRYLKRLVGRE